MLMKTKNQIKILAVAAALLTVATPALAISTYAISLVGAYNFGDPGIYAIDSNSSGGSQVIATASGGFTGLNGNGNSQSMTYSGLTRDSAEFGRLHCYANLAVENSFYNPSNPHYWDTNTNMPNPNGVPDGMASLGFAGFNETFQFGGMLGAGYRARYVFFAEGDNTGGGALADLAFNPEGLPSESFFAFNTGHTAEYWTTQSYEINGITPMAINVQFSNQVVFDFNGYADGSNLAGISDFSSTVTLERIDVYDPAGNLAGGITVTSGSGTNYIVTPEPSVMIGLGLGLVCLLRRRRKS